MYLNILKYLVRLERDAGELQGAKRKCPQWWNIICSTSGWQNFLYPKKIFVKIVKFIYINCEDILWEIKCSPLSW